MVAIRHGAGGPTFRFSLMLFRITRSVSTFAKAAAPTLALAYAGMLVLTESAKAIDNPDDPWSLQLLGRFEDSAAFDSEELQVLRSGWRLGGGLKVIPGVPLRFSLDFEYSHYSLGASSLPPGKILDDAYSLRYSMILGAPLSERLLIAAIPRIQAAGDFDANWSDSITWSVPAGFYYKLTDNISILAGVIVRSHLEDEIRVIPVGGLDWKFSDSLRLISRGPEAALEWNPWTDATVALDFAYEPRDYRLADNSVVPGGVLEDDTLALSLGWQQKWASGLLTKINAGLLFGRELEVLDHNGRLVLNETPDPTPFVSIMLEWRF
jgi:hypothetical protein